MPSFPGGIQQPLYENKANLFKALAHPARIRVLEILSSNVRCRLLPRRHLRVADAEMTR